MRNRTLRTSVNLLVEPEMYQRIKMAASLKRIPMSKVIRDGIKLVLAKIDKENNAVIEGTLE